MTGRPRTYTEDLADRICDGLANARSLRAICRDADMPAPSTIFRWLADERYAAFRLRYARAREAQADAIFDELLDIADDASGDWTERAEGDRRGPGRDFDRDHIQRVKLRIDARKWMAAKLAPKRYGDRLEVEHGGGITLAISGEDAEL